MHHSGQSQAMHAQKEDNANISVPIHVKQEQVNHKNISSRHLHVIGKTIVQLPCHVGIT